MQSVPLPDRRERLAAAVDRAWEICFHRIASGLLVIHREASLQLHLGLIVQGFGELACLAPDERFTLELESGHHGKSIDLFCTLGDPRDERDAMHAAIELKCFLKSSNRATDLDMCDALQDVVRLESYDHAAVRRFLCLTDNPYYPKGAHRGHAGPVSIRDGRLLPAGGEIVPGWKGIWEDHSRDKPLRLKREARLDWQESNGWYALRLDV